MLHDDAIREGERVMTICNSCRYCEGFCAVFPAMERRLTFAEADMDYLANLCHNCTECVHACQYAPPHQFAVNVPVTLAHIRVRSYEKYCWPPALGLVFRLHGTATALLIAATLLAAITVSAYTLGHGISASQGTDATFYSVVPHEVMMGAFGAVFVWVLAAMTMGVARYLKGTTGRASIGQPFSILEGLRHAATLKYLHGSGKNCPTTERARTPWRRWAHHLTFYGFLLCFAATTVAAVYDLALHWRAPYPFVSVPVLLGTSGGIGLFLGPLALWRIHARSDPRTVAYERRDLDHAFILMLVLTSATGLALLALRDTVVMGPLLLLHLAIVLTLFVTLPYGIFVHGLYRTAALIRHADESRSNLGGAQ